MVYVSATSVSWHLGATRWQVFSRSIAECWFSEEGRRRKDLSARAGTGAFATGVSSGKRQSGTGWSGGVGGLGQAFGARDKRA